MKSVFLDSHYPPYIKCPCVHNYIVQLSDMKNGSFTWTGFVLRLLFALVLVYATYNPEGFSYFHWIEASLNHTETGLLGSNALKFVVGILLLSGWLLYANATRESLGVFGIFLILAFCGGIIWFFAEMNLFQPANIKLIVHLTEFVVAIVLAVGISWSHIHRRLTGQIDIDEHHH